jgi:regulator of replication initiation timing
MNIGEKLFPSPQDKLANALKEVQRLKNECLKISLENESLITENTKLKSELAAIKNKRA